MNLPTDITAGTETCPVGYSFVTDSFDCRAAALSDGVSQSNVEYYGDEEDELGIPDPINGNFQDNSGWPLGCFRYAPHGTDPKGGRFYFNTGDSGHTTYVEKHVRWCKMQVPTGQCSRQISEVECQDNCMQTTGCEEFSISKYYGCKWAKDSTGCRPTGTMSFHLSIHGGDSTGCAGNGDCDFYEKLTPFHLTSMGLMCHFNYHQSSASSEIECAELCRNTTGCSAYSMGHASSGFGCRYAKTSDGCCERTEFGDGRAGTDAAGTTRMGLWDYCTPYQGFNEKCETTTGFDVCKYYEISGTCSPARCREQALQLGYTFFGDGTSPFIGSKYDTTTGYQKGCYVKNGKVTHADGTETTEDIVWYGAAGTEDEKKSTVLTGGATRILACDGTR